MRNPSDFEGWAIEPYRDGAVVTAPVVDANEAIANKQLTIFCRRSKPGVVFLMGIWSWLSPPTTSGDLTREVQRDVTGSRLKIGGQTIREQANLDGIADLHVDNEGRFHMTYTLTTAEFERGAQLGIEVEADVPHWLGWTFRLAPPTAGLLQHTAIAFKSCL